MRILMLAPQPFFRARGTPFSVLQRVQGLILLGHTVDLVTYPFGEDVDLVGLKIHRVSAVPGIRDIAIGPSISKVLLDLPLFTTALKLARTGEFEVIHTHEEAAIMGAWLSRRYGLPHIYDMHSSLPEQFSNFERFNWRPVVGLFRRLEEYTLNRTDLLITVCPELDEHVKASGFQRPHAMIENTLELTKGVIDPAEADRLRDELGLSGKQLVVYTGTLESYQGIDLLLSSVPAVVAEVPDAHFLVVGGTPEQSDSLRATASELGVAEHFISIPAVAPERVPAYQRMATTLVTCRVRGINTPLKLYQYLRAARPIVATAIRSHTQVLDAECAELVEPDTNGIATGLIRVLTDRARAEALAASARRVAAERYNAEIYMNRLTWIMDHAEALVRRTGAAMESSITVL